MLRLAEATGDFAAAAAALAATIAAGEAPPLTLAHLHERRGNLLEERIGDLAAASESHAAALALTPERLEPRRCLLRTLVRLGRFGEAAKLLVDPSCAPDARDSVLMPLYQSLALEANQLSAALTALAKAVGDAPGLDAPTRRDLHLRVAAAFLDHSQDTEAAEHLLEQALAADPGSRRDAVAARGAAAAPSPIAGWSTRSCGWRPSSRQPGLPARSGRHRGERARGRGAGDRAAGPAG